MIQSVEQICADFRNALETGASISKLYSIAERGYTRVSVDGRLSTNLVKVVDSDDAVNRIAESLSIHTVHDWLKTPWEQIVSADGVADRTVNKVDKAVTAFFGRHLRGISNAVFLQALSVRILCEEQLVSVNGGEMKLKIPSAWPVLAQYRRDLLAVEEEQYE